MKTLMIDMDDVITRGNFHEYVEEFMGIKIDMDKTTNYYIIQETVESKKEEFWNYVKDKDLYKGASLFEDCYEVLEKLNKKYDIYIVTSYLWRDVIDISGKNLGYKYYYLKFDIKLDDKIGNLEGADTKILFNSWHNNHETYSEDIIRVNNWKEVGDVLL